MFRIEFHETDPQGTWFASRISQPFNQDAAFVAGVVSEAVKQAGDIEPNLDDDFGPRIAKVVSVPGNEVAAEFPFESDQETAEAIYADVRDRLRSL